MAVDFSTFVCPVPLRRYPQIVSGHGSGGQMMQELITHLFAPAFGDAADFQTDAAVVQLDGRCAFTTDSFVVSPLFFPGGDVGSLAVHGTVNDLAMMGARPLYLSAGFILEEGLPMEQLGVIVQSMAAAARAAGVRVITGDTKVVGRGHGDGVFINTSGLGIIPPGVIIGPGRIQPGDAILVNGPLGDHGVAIMSVRAGLAFETALISDSAPLAEPVALLLATDSQAVHALRDLTRGGLAAAANELARAAGVGLLIDENQTPVQPAVANACELLGLDPLQVANEGKFMAIVRGDSADALLHALRQHPLGRQAALIGHVTDQHPGMVVGRTAIGSRRVIDVPAGELLPRIC